jgi:DnaJ-class molecular chaperone
MAGKDYYTILGVNRNATEKEIKQAYRRLARQYHPDVNPGNKDAEARFKEINAAYEVISDPEKRKKFDQYGENWEHADQFAQAASNTGNWNFTQQPGGGEVRYEEGDLDSIFGDLFSQGASGFRRRSRARRGDDIEYQVEVTLEEAYQGSRRRITLQSEEVCKACQGTGRIQNLACSVCRGTGATAKANRLEVKIPAGVNNGSRIRLAGKGQPGSGGGQAGDLYLVVTVLPHNIFERKEDDLYIDMPVPLTVAVLGGEIEVPTLKGKVALKIPPETQNERVFRLAGQGMPQLGDSTRGDLMVKVKVQVPTGLSDKEQELFKKLKELRPN